MAKKAFEIQGSDLKLGGVSLQAGTTGVVIPGVTQAANYKVEEVEDTDDQTYNEFPTNSEVVVIDAALYAAIVAEGNESTFADFTATTDDDGEIDEIEVNGQGTYTQQQANTAKDNDMYAYIGSASASDRPLVPEDWIQIPFRPKMRAGVVENVGGGSSDTGNVTFSDVVVQGEEWELGLSPSPNFTDGSYTGGAGGPDLGPQYFRVRGGDNYEHLHFDTTDNSKFDLYIGDDAKYFKLSKNGPAIIGTEAPDEPYNRHTWSFGTDGSLTFPDGSVQTSAGGSGSLSPELTKSNGTVIANATVQFGESNSGLIAVVDSGGNDGQWFAYSVGDADGAMYACGTNDAGPQYVWAFNPDGTVKWKVGIDQINGYDAVPRTLAIDGDYLIVGITYFTTDTEEREIGVLVLSLADGTSPSSYTKSTNTVGSKRIRAFAIGPEGSHIIAGSLDGETIPENNITPNREAWGSKVDVLTVANNSLSSPIVPWDYNLEVQNNPLDANAWYSPNSINYFRDLPVTSVTGTGGPQNYNIDNDYALGKLQLVVGDSGTTWLLRLDASWVNGAAQAHVLAQTGAYSFTITTTAAPFVTTLTTSWVDIGGGIYEAGTTVGNVLVDGTYDITALLINKSVMTVELRYVPAGLTNGPYTAGMIDAWNVQNSGQGYSSGDVVKVLGSQMGGVDTITLTGAPAVYGTNENIYFSSITYPEMSQVQNGWRISGPGITGWATLFNVQDTGGAYRFDIAPGSTITSGETYTIDNNGNDIAFSLYDYGGNYFVISSDPAGKVADAVAATTRIVMSQGVDYRGVENTTTYTAGTEYTAGQVRMIGTGPWNVVVNPALTLINSEMTQGKEIVLTVGLTSVTVTIESVLGINGDGDYDYGVSDASGLGSNSIDLDSIEIPNGTYTGTWNLRRGLNSQAFILGDGWSHTYGGDSWEQFSSVVYDSFDDSIYALGEFYNGDNEIALFKLDTTTGDTIWVKYVEDNEGDGNDAGTVAVDGTGNVYTCATNNNGDTIVTKLDSTGTLVWQVRQQNSDLWNNQPSMVLDSNGDIIVGGSFDNQNDPINSHYVWSFMKLSKTDGSLIWARYLDNQEKYAMYDMEDYDIQPMSVQGDDIYYAGMAYDENDNYYVALSFKFNTSGAGLGTYGRWIWLADENASWTDNTSNAVVTTATIPEVDQTTFASNSATISVTADAVGSVTPAGYVLGGEGKLVFVDGSELKSAGIARHSVDNGDNTTWLNASMNGKFIYYADNPGGFNSTIRVPTNADTPLPIGFTLTIVMGDFNNSRIYVNNDGNSDVQILVAGSDNFSNNYWQCNANTSAAGVYTIMKVDTNTWMLAGPDITVD
jgi:hypothetical protein